jgi:transposase
MLISRTIKTEHSARVLARDNDGNIYLPLGVVGTGPWANEVRWVEDTIDQLWFDDANKVDKAIAQIKHGQSKYHIVGDIELLTRTVTTEISSTRRLKGDFS